jgi:hypothetical protein
MPTKGMTWHELPPRNPAPPRIIDYSQQQPEKPPVPHGLRETLTFLPSAVARAVFQEMEGAPRMIPTASDEVLIKPGRGFVISCAFELPAIGELGALDGKILQVFNLTHHTHTLISPSGYLIDGMSDGEIALQEMGSNIKLRAVGGTWVVLSLYKTRIAAIQKKEKSK